MAVRDAEGVAEGTCEHERLNVGEEVEVREGECGDGVAERVELGEHVAEGVPVKVGSSDSVCESVTRADAVAVGVREAL